ncbi:unannotated protein [freshwater metagenome]|uniref:Unannotated protein n=1 Tax=freshwater metagenome TaxID=449393 RepID=A0A6J7I8T6_9ZZZZ|nr:tetratricopeptide repeat protein [Actinomycetota bacterium]
MPVPSPPPAATPVPAPRLYLSHDADLGLLVALEHGRVADDQPRGCWAPVAETFAYLLAAPGGRAVGFGLDEFDRFDPDDPELAEIWDAPRFDVPSLGLTDASAGEIATAARHRFGPDEDSLNRRLAAEAKSLRGEEALERWRACLETGDGSAHYAVGYTLCHLGRHPEAYSHLRHHTEIAPRSSWSWCWLGRAAEAIDRPSEAREAYRTAIELDPDGRTGARRNAERRLGEMPPAAVDHPGHDPSGRPAG